MKNKQKFQVFESHFLGKRYTETVAPPVNPFVRPKNCYSDTYSSKEINKTAQNF
jgi:hypothetical protein